MNTDELRCILSICVDLCPSVVPGSLKISAATFDLACFDDEAVAFDRARNADRMTTALQLADSSNGKPPPAVVAHHVFAVLVIALLGVEAHFASVHRDAISAVPTLDGKEAHWCSVGQSVIEELHLAGCQI